MIIGDMQRKCEAGMRKVKEAISAHGGTTLLATGITGDDARFALAAVQAGARMLEPNHPAVALARGYKGVTSMHAAEDIRHEIAMEEMVKVTAGVRAVVGLDIFYYGGCSGFFYRKSCQPCSPRNMLMPCRALAQTAFILINPP